VRRTIEAALIDVGGTLWPNSWPLRATDGHGRHERVAAALPSLSPETVDALVVDLIERSRFGDEARAVTTEVVLPIEAAGLVSACLTLHGLSTDAGTVARVRRAMALPVTDRLRPLPGAAELLAEAHQLGLRTVIASNTYWRDAESYWEDFRAFGLAEHIDAIVTSNDAGYLKPHPAVFEMAIRTAGAEPGRCVVIGNREENDVLPALALGMRTILVHPDDPAPAASRADVVAPDLWACAKALRDMLGS
jgi:HAD superfamily hydrolase (TIGR01509 family)